MIAWKVNDSSERKVVMVWGREKRRCLGFRSERLVRFVVSIGVGGILSRILGFGSQGLRCHSEWWCRQL